MYKDYGLICKCKLNDDGTNAVLDLPFQVFHQEVVHKGQNYRCQPLPKELDGQEVFAVVRVSTSERRDPNTGVVTVTNDEAKADKHAGKVTDYKTDAKVAVHWNVKKEDYYATTDKDDAVVKYDGADKDELAPFCVSTVTMPEKYVVEEEVVGKSLIK